MNNKSTPMRADSIDFLTGKKSGRPWPGGISLPGKGGKFLSDGSIQLWPGNTFVRHVDAKSPEHDHLRALQEEVKMSRFARFFTFLPPSSFHMTVFEGVSPQATDAALLPTGTNAEMPRDAMSETMLNAVDDIRFDATQTVKMDGLFCAFSLRVSRVGEQGDLPLRAARKTLRSATGINPPGFDDYTFHITLAYLLQWLTEPTAHALVDFSDELVMRYSQKLSAIALGPVEFCNFETMHHFEPLMRMA
ncbi:MAG: DUF1868 domain-containing protein [Granulosicoccus sp.]